MNKKEFELTRISTADFDLEKKIGRRRCTRILEWFGRRSRPKLEYIDNI